MKTFAQRMRSGLVIVILVISSSFVLGGLTGAAIMWCLG